MGEISEGRVDIISSSFLAVNGQEEVWKEMHVVIGRADCGTKRVAGR
jgi:hypothetical protein